MGYEPSDPTHAEASAILYLFGGFSPRVSPRFYNGQISAALESILEDEKEYIKNPSNKIKIIGSITFVSTLNDPCSICMPMFYSFKENLGRILREQVRRYVSIEMGENLENLILIEGVKPYEGSRARMNPVDEKITLDFENPSNRLYSKCSNRDSREIPPIVQSTAPQAYQSMPEKDLSEDELSQQQKRKPHSSAAVHIRCIAQWASIS